MTALMIFRRALALALGGADLFPQIRQYGHRIVLRLAGLPSCREISAAILVPWKGPSGAYA